MTKVVRAALESFGSGDAIAIDNGAQPDIAMSEFTCRLLARRAFSSSAVSPAFEESRLRRGHGS
jgi:hypothetical protein